MKTEQKAYNRIVAKVANKLSLPPEVVDKTYKSYWGFVKETLSSLPLKKNLTEEEFSQLRININVPALGKFYCTFDNYVGIKKRYEYLQKLKNNVEDKENQASV